MSIHDELQKFIATTKPTGQISVLQPYMDVVTELYVRNYTQEQIASFFCQQNIIVSRDAVGLFIRKNIANKYSDLRKKVNSPLTINESTEKQKKEYQENEINQDQQELPVMLTQQKKTFKFNPAGQPQD